MTTKSYVKTIERERANGAVVFACKIPVSTSGNISMYVQWEIYPNNFGKVKTVCYAKLTRDGKSFKEEMQYSGFALLHPEHPEEFDVQIGIKKSFARLVRSMVDSQKLKRYIFIEDEKLVRKQIWARFNEIFENSFESDSFEIGDRTYCYDISDVKAVIDHPAAVWEIEVEDLVENIT